jgi:hypothetical protein
MAPPHTKYKSHRSVTQLRSGYQCSVVRLRLLDKKKAAASSATALALGTVVMFSTDGLSAIGMPVQPVSLPIFGEGVDVLFFALVILSMVIAAFTAILTVRNNQLGRK